LKLKLHREQTRKGMALMEVLHRLHVLKDLRIDPVTSVVESYRSLNGQPKQWRVISQVPASDPSTGYRFVNVSYNGMKKKVGVHVLQWMQRHGNALQWASGEYMYSTGIPEGHDVHHLPPQPPRPGAKNNALALLEVVPSHLNRNNHWHAQQQQDDF
jgi:hypothetical protein